MRSEAEIRHAVELVEKSLMAAAELRDAGDPKADEMGKTIIRHLTTLRWVMGEENVFGKLLANLKDQEKLAAHLERAERAELN